MARKRPKLPKKSGNIWKSTIAILVLAIAVGVASFCSRNNNEENQIVNPVAMKD